MTYWLILAEELCICSSYQDSPILRDSLWAGNGSNAAAGAASGRMKRIYYLALEEQGPDKLWGDVLWIRMLGDPIMRKAFSMIAYFCTGDITVLCLLERILCFAWHRLNRKVCQMKKPSHYYLVIWIFYSFYPEKHLIKILLFQTVFPFHYRAPLLVRERQRVCAACPEGSLLFVTGQGPPKVSGTERSKCFPSCPCSALCCCCPRLIAPCRTQDLSKSWWPAAVQ